ncbi:MAG: hypothetical protein C4K49_10005 [Candidatus Thorarchaeota archaeon]|nr:MAG: hypothetical protein C4K49_10005 [Candidatus Thorarchaeota archaeon]
MAINVIAFFSPITPERSRVKVQGELRKSGVSVMSPEEFLVLANRDQVTLNQHNVVFVGSGGTESLIAAFLSRINLGPPIMLLSHDGNNSLPAAMETRAYLSVKGLQSRITHASLPKLVERLREWQDYSNMEHRIRSSRIGLVGKPSSWLISSHVIPSAVEETWGSSIVEIPLSEISGASADSDGEDTRVNLDDFAARAISKDVTDTDIRNAGLVARALLSLVNRHKLNAVTVECFALLEQSGISGCCAMSRLNDVDGLAAGCEGDVPSTFTMMVAKYATGQPAFMANVTDVDSDANSIVLAHCTVPVSLVSDYDLTSHFETGRSVAVRGRFIPQAVTLLKLWGNDLSEYWVSGGSIEENLTNSAGCRTQVRVHVEKPVTYFLERSLANHHILILGDYSERLDRFLSFALRR